MAQNWGGPYRFRTFLRGHLPWFIIDLGFVDKGSDCEAEGGLHEWYNVDNKISACYHCKIEKEGQLWKQETT
jgi:hypothetical protein